MFSSSRMTLNQSALYGGPLEELQELAFIERPIRRSLKVFITLFILLLFIISVKVLIESDRWD